MALQKQFSSSRSQAFKWPLALVFITGIVLAIIPGRAVAQSTGFIQVDCENEVQVFIDGNLKGTTSDSRGLAISGIEPGQRSVRAEKSGCLPQEKVITVSRGGIANVVFKKFERVSGRLIVNGFPSSWDLPFAYTMSAPLAALSDEYRRELIDRGEVVIEDGDQLFPIRGGRSREVGDLARTLPVGRYKIAAFQEVPGRDASGDSIETYVEITADDEVTVFFDFASRTVQVTSARSEGARAEASRREADSEFRDAGGIVVNLGQDVLLRLVKIEPGRFNMGTSTEDAMLVIPAETPQHAVTISRQFWIGQTEVTQSQWEAVMGKREWYFPRDPFRPADSIYWSMAQDFCRRLSEGTTLSDGRKMTFRLPTEAEWEYACRAGTMPFRYFKKGESSLSDHAWHDDNSRNKTQCVGMKLPNPWGLYDMYGNVEEWCQDWYDERYYSESPSKDPQGPKSGRVRSIRGGCYNSDGVQLRSSWRGCSIPDRPMGNEQSGWGFRIVGYPSP